MKNTDKIRLNLVVGKLIEFNSQLSGPGFSNQLTKLSALLNPPGMRELVKNNFDYIDRSIQENLSKLENPAIGQLYSARMHLHLACQSKPSNKRPSNKPAYMVLPHEQKKY